MRRNIKRESGRVRVIGRPEAKEGLKFECVLRFGLCVRCRVDRSFRETSWICASFVRPSLSGMMVHEWGSSPGGRSTAVHSGVSHGEDQSS